MISPSFEWPVSGAVNAMEAVTVEPEGPSPPHRLTEGAAGDDGNLRLLSPFAFSANEVWLEKLPAFFFDVRIPLLLWLITQHPPLDIFFFPVFLWYHFMIPVESLHSLILQRSQEDLKPLSSLKG